MDRKWAGFGLGGAWVMLTACLALHVLDEAANDFLSFYNPMVESIRETRTWLPFPVFSYEVWLGGLIAAVLLLFVLSTSAYRGKKWMIYVSYFYGCVMILNALGHIAGSVYFGRMLPGLYSSPLLLFAAIYLVWKARSLPLGS
jgi:hypothetical protein